MADAALQELVAACRGREGALEVVRLGDKYALQLRRDAITYGRRLAPQEIPGHLLRTLALVAHEQPMLQSELKRRMGDRVYEHVGELLELGMLERERAGRSFALSVTEAFDEAEAARSLGVAWREFRGYHAFPLGAVGERSEEERLRAAAERLGLETDGLAEAELRITLQARLSKE